MTHDFSDIRQQFESYVGDIVYATMTTVDAKGRPRARVLIPIWEIVDGAPLGWLVTYKTPVKAAHLAGNPHATFSYWDRRQNAVAVDTVTRWVDDPAEKARIWDLYRRDSYDPGRFWTGPDDPKYHLLRLEPWRIQVIRGTDLKSTIWRATLVGADSA